MSTPDTTRPTAPASTEDRTDDRYPVVLHDAEWRRRLTPQEYAVLRQAGTERAITGE